MTLHIAPYTEEYHDRLVKIWLRAVSQTHDFLTEEDIRFYYEMVENGALRAVEIWVYLNPEQEPIGFIGLDGPKIEMLFVDPLHHGQGTGTKLIRHAEQLKGRGLQVDVNEQNPKAHAFYKKYGFVQIGRSELDGSGKPFPLIHWSWISAAEPIDQKWVSGGPLGALISHGTQKTPSFDGVFFYVPVGVRP